MSEQAIKKLKKRFIMLATLSFMIAMVVVGSFIYIANTMMTSSEVKEVLDSIVENDGDLPESMGGSSKSTSQGLRNASKDDSGVVQDLQSIFGTSHYYSSPEFVHTVRYFAVTLNKDGSAKDVKLRHISSVNEDDAVKYARTLKSRRSDFGRFGSYYYTYKTRSDGSTIVVIMDCTTQVSNSRNLLTSAMVILLIGMVITYIVMRLLAGRVIQPEIKNAELQKQFITNASHELKTPLAVISANTEIIEATSGESEWTRSTMKQVARLQSLIKNLVMVTRSGEQNADAEIKDIDVSKVVSDTASTFRPVAEQDGKKFAEEIDSGIHTKAAEEDIRQLASLLIDNAIKYCDDGGTVKVGLSRKGRQTRLWVSNDYAEGENVDYSRFFDRFYREDKSHNTEKGGFGIGLSIAENLVEKYNGKIDVSWKDGVITFMCQR
ncbi:MAG: sensor histidine kinase [Anaerovoracaceae bacterium]